MISLLILPIIISFFLVLFLMPLWIRKAKQINLLWNDVNKINAPKVAGSGGIMVLLGFITGVFIFIAYRTFYLNDSSYIIEMLSLVLVVVLVGGIGFLDDLLGWQRGGLSRRSRLILLFLSAIPLMAINAGRHSMSLPFLGAIDFGIIYPLIIIPIGIMGATSTFNFLAGFNGLEAGQGIIILSALSIVAYFTGSSWLAIIALCMVLSLLAFLIFNFYPAKVFPGDILTYPVGCLIAIIAVLGNFEKIAIFFFIPYVFEVILKSRGRLIKSSFGRPNRDGTLDLRYDKIYGMTHASIFVLKKLGIKSTEKNAVYLIWTFQILVIVVGFLIFRKGIFLS